MKFILVKPVLWASSLVGCLERFCKKRYIRRNPDGSGYLVEPWFFFVRMLNRAAIQLTRLEGRILLGEWRG